MAVGIPEFDRVLGGGIVPGSVVLVGGDPGIGKSTLMMQMASALAAAPRSILQGRSRSARSSCAPSACRCKPPESLLLLAETNLEVIEAVLDAGRAPDLLIVDSIQTMYRPDLESAPGTVSQVREATGHLHAHCEDARTSRCFWSDT